MSSLLGSDSILPVTYPELVDFALAKGGFCRGFHVDAHMRSFVIVEVYGERDRLPNLFNVSEAQSGMPLSTT